MERPWLVPIQKRNRSCDEGEFSHDTDDPKDWNWGQRYHAERLLSGDPKVRFVGLVHSRSARIRTGNGDRRRQATPVRTVPSGI